MSRDDAPPSDASAADRLIAELEAEGVHRGAGRFTVDRRVAREKVARFALPDPEDYILLLVRCAVRQGATRLYVRVDADELRMEWDGRPFTRAELEDLYPNLLEGDPGAPGGLRELATALVTAQRLELRRVTVTSGDEDGVEMTVRPEKPETFADATLEPPGTRLHVKRALSMTVMSRQGAELAGTLPEEALLARRCRYADLAIDVNGRPLPRGPLGADLEALLDVEGPGVDGGVAGFRPDDEAPGHIHLVRDGVWIDTAEEPLLLPGFEAVIVADGLRTDLTGFRVVRDAAWREVLSTVKATQEQVLRDLAERLHAQIGFRRNLHPWARRLLEDAVSRAPRKRSRLRGLLDRH